MKIPDLRIVAFLLFSGCQRNPSEVDIRQEFLAEHPGAIVISIDDVTGDNRLSRIPIRYKKPNDSNVYLESWTYSSKDGSHWKRVKQ